MEDQERNDSPEESLGHPLTDAGGPPIIVEAPRKSRITVVDMVYHQPADLPPTTMLGDAMRFSRELESDEQPYERRLLATEDWKPLDCGWISKVGMLLLRNDEGFFSVRPTPEQRAEVALRVIEITFDYCLNPSDSPLCSSTDPYGRCILVPPGESCRFFPEDAKSLRVRCRSGRAQYTISLSPR